jgi:hypothetical protein
MFKNWQFFDTFWRHVDCFGMSVSRFFFSKEVDYGKGKFGFSVGIYVVGGV